MNINKAFLSSMLCTLLILLLSPCFAYGAGYGEITAEIPVAFQNSSSTAHDCIAVIEPIDDAVKPQQGEITVESGGESRFKITFDKPGTAKYKIYQKAGNKSGVIYDDSVYLVTAAAVNSPNGESEPKLEYVIYATLNGAQKTDSIRFENTDKETGGSYFGGGGGGGGGSSPGKSHTVNPPEDLTRPSHSPTDKAPDKTPPYTPEEQTKITPEGETEPPTGQDQGGTLIDRTEPKSEITTPGEETTALQNPSEETVDTGDSNRQELPLGVMLLSAVIFALTFVMENRAKKANNRNESY